MPSLESPLRSSFKSFASNYKLVLVTLGILALVAHAHLQVEEEQVFAKDVADSVIVAPDGAPPITQESIDLAMQMFGIRLPSGTEPPVLDLNMQDRGLTTRSPILDKARVAIGPAAFSSWALLGSTLAHEIEVHCQQNFFAIYVMDLIGLDGTGAAERQAYVHELSHAHRFGTLDDDAKMIADTVAFYYPEAEAKTNVSLTSPVKSWVARAFLAAALVPSAK
ncbi:MAG: hypothetical protein RL011_2256 [Pseudomonadota bacterium]